MAVKGLGDMVLYNLSLALNTEDTLYEGLETMRSMAQDDQIRLMLDDHMSESLKGRGCLQQAFQMLGQQPLMVSSLTAKCLIDDFRNFSKLLENPTFIDLAILDSWAQGEHLKIAMYRGLAEKAQLLGNDRLHEILLQILADAEKTAHMVERTAVSLAKQITGGGSAM